MVVGESGQGVALMPQCAAVEPAVDGGYKPPGNLPTPRTRAMPTWSSPNRKGRPTSRASLPPGSLTPRRCSPPSPPAAQSTVPLIQNPIRSSIRFIMPAAYLLAPPGASSKPDGCKVLAHASPPTRFWSCLAKGACSTHPILRRRRRPLPGHLAGPGPEGNGIPARDIPEAKKVCKSQGELLCIDSEIRAAAPELQLFYPFRSPCTGFIIAARRAG